MADTNVEMIVVEKFGTLKQTIMKKFSEDDLYKKCGFKKDNGFSKQTEWSITLDKIKYIVELYGKTDGKANMENKYDFPPPVDTTLFFGACVLVCKNAKDKSVCDLTTEMWDKMYEKLFGGFEDLSATAYDDENEVDELASVPNSYKTKSGYLKDGFIVEDDDEIVMDNASKSTSSSACSDEFESGSSSENEIIIHELELEDIGSELDEEEYEYEDEI